MTKSETPETPQIDAGRPWQRRPETSKNINQRRELDGGAIASPWGECASPRLGWCSPRSAAGWTAASPPPPTGRPWPPRPRLSTRPPFSRSVSSQPKRPPQQFAGRAQNRSGENQEELPRNRNRQEGIQPNPSALCTSVLLLQEQRWGRDWGAEEEDGTFYSELRTAVCGGWRSAGGGCCCGRMKRLRFALRLLGLAVCPSSPFALSDPNPNARDLIPTSRKVREARSRGRVGMDPVRTSRPARARYMWFIHMTELFTRKVSEHPSIWLQYTRHIIKL